MAALEQGEPDGEALHVEEIIDSDLELEQALPQLSDEGSDEQLSPPTYPGDGSGTPHEPYLAICPPHLSVTDPAPAGPSASFRLPPPPAMPQDLSLIADLVSSHQVVGALPPLSISAAEKRKLVEASLRQRALSKGNGKEREVKPVVEALQVKIEDGAESVPDSDSSSEFESDMSDDDADETEPGQQTKPMTAEEHATIKSELDKLVHGDRPPEPSTTETTHDRGSTSSDTGSEVESDSSSDSSPDEEVVLGYESITSPFPSPRIPKLAHKLDFEFMDGDDEEVVADDPILSKNEVLLPPVAQPPLQRLPAGEGTSLAGEVVTWMRERKVEAWLEKQARDDLKGPRSETGKDNPEKQEPAEADPEMDEEDIAREGGQLTALPLGVGEKERSAESANEMVTAPLLDGDEVDKRKREAVPFPSFHSAGTVVIRAMQERPGLESWLEEGSVVCWADGRVVGTISDIFGPLTAPFYSIRLPPPPHPYPSPADLCEGVRLHYPLSSGYRSFVNMHAVRDPRYKGTDASNFFDEEVGEDEVDWSDDEAEAEAKRRKKMKRGASRTPSDAVPGPSRRGSQSSMMEGVGGGSGLAGLPVRPHFDYQPEDESDAGSMYGMEDEAFSETASSLGGRGRPMPAPYDLEDTDDAETAVRGGPDERRQRSDRGGRGDPRDRRGAGRGGGGMRGQARERGRGRGGERERGAGGRHADGGGRGRGRHRGQGGNNAHRDHDHGHRHSATPADVGPPSASSYSRSRSSLPPRPQEIPPSTLPALRFPLADRGPARRQPIQPAPHEHQGGASSSFRNPEANFEPGGGGYDPSRPQSGYEGTSISALQNGPYQGESLYPIERYQGGFGANHGASYTPGCAPHEYQPHQRHPPPPLSPALAMVARPQSVSHWAPPPQSHGRDSRSYQAPHSPHQSPYPLPHSPHQPSYPQQQQLPPFPFPAPAPIGFAQPSFSQPQVPSPGTPAINPRFAAMYAQQIQGGGAGYGWQSGDGYSE